LTQTKEDIETFVFEAIATFGPDPEAVNRDATLESLDVDSLDLVELGQMVEERYGLRLQADDMADVKTVGDAIDVIAAKVG
jgi:acyl carrier protein